jgi:predicted DCC family thiol-disulfide oxidoreductase YuxK
MRTRFHGNALRSYQRHFCHQSRAFATAGSFSEGAANVSHVGSALLLYDDDCGFCRVCVAVVLVWDRHRRLRPVALQSDEAGGLLAGMPVPERMASWHLSAPGRLHSAGAAFPPLLRELPGATGLAALAERFPAVAERAYRLVARHRSALGRVLPERARRWADATIERHRADRNFAGRHPLSSW